MSNLTFVSEFILMVFSDIRELQIVYSLLFLLIVLATILGNLLIVIVTTVDRHLHTSMYFFLRNLSLVDACYITVTLPEASTNSLLNSRTISKSECVAQIFLMVFFVYVELTCLAIMAHDRYVAICHPLHYTVIMNPRVCMQMTLTSLLTGLLYAGFHTAYTFRLPFCRSNVIQQFFCDIPSLLKLSCSETFSNEILIIVTGMGVRGGCFAFIIASYVRIFSTVLKFPVKEDQRKAFSTCITHIIVVLVFLISSFYVYLRPSSISASIEDLVLSVFYSVIPSFVNPIIYSLRNKQIKEAVQRVVNRNIFS
ncbi:olfactory receptor 14C36-like [Sarcophilus harrisii]|uniref:G-protein coupled receptors family 1 profile domain-containing protein n=1 Tax=Sarcophilus harrisii TaxID=9305 RepID=A0A7N4NHQ5_SARHA|nr:olfactory receptor 14C36-like [Sarcophilus harrisii]